MWAAMMVVACSSPPPAEPPPQVQATVYLTSAAGAAMEESQVAFTERGGPATLTVRGDRAKQRLFGIGGSLTQASAAALSTLSAEKRAEVLAAAFGPDGAHYSLSRTHIGSSDFSESSYTYQDSADTAFSIQPDVDNGLLTLIQDAKAVPGARFELIASPWTAPAWMKDNGKLYEPEAGRGGSLLEAHHQSFAGYLVNYLQAYAAEGIDVWAITPVNEPQGNAGTWESMEMSAEQQRDLLRVLGPQLQRAGLSTQVLIFDQNRAEMAEFTEVIFSDEVASAVASGTAVHWYNSTTKVYEDELDAQHERHPDKWIIHSEGTIDSVAGEASCKEACPNPPCGCEELYAWWQDDPWYWKKEATDWGWDWAPNREVDHPKYAPAFRYARDLVVGLDHWLAGWVDWNFVLDKRGGPNHVGNYCLAPILVDGETDSVYYTPLYYVISQVSRHAPPDSVVLETQRAETPLASVAIRTPDGRHVVHVFNESPEDVSYTVDINGLQAELTSPAASLQTVVLGP